VTWRRLGVPALEALVGAGVLFGAAGAEARAMKPWTSSSWGPELRWSSGRVRTGRLESLTLRDRATAATEVVPAVALFLLNGATTMGSFAAGPELLHGGAASPPRPLRRPPLLFETKIPASAPFR
jgi:thioredoxin reductase (NADPH)